MENGSIYIYSLLCGIVLRESFGWSCYSNMFAALLDWYLVVIARGSQEP